MKTSYVSVTDLFCGAGGSSIGVRAAGADLRLALNHWPKAIETHNSNFPNALHECCDVRATDPRRYPTTDILIASPECTAHTLAKGRKRQGIAQRDLWGMDQLDPAEERSRVTMWDVPRFCEVHDYRLVLVENVVDARRYWRPFDAWLAAMASLGYEHQTIYVNSMHVHPTPQSRDRLYVVFHKRGNRRPDLRITPRAWCTRCVCDVDAVQSWKDPSRPWGKYGTRQQYLYCCPTCSTVVEPYYFAAANAIDWSLKGERIGDRKKPLADKTLQRIRYGLERFGRQALAMRYDGEKLRPTSDALPTQTTREVMATVVPPFVLGMERAGTPGRVSEWTQPYPTQTGRQDKALVVPPFLVSPNHRNLRATPVEAAHPTQTASLRQAVVVPPFIAELRNNSTARSAEDPLSTLTAGGGHHGLVIPPLLLGQQSESRARPTTAAMMTVSTAGAISLIVPAGGTWEDAPRSTEEPFPTQTTRDAFGIATVPPFFVSYYGKRHATHPLDESLVTVSARSNHALVLPYHSTSVARDTTEALPTLTTRDREALVTWDELPAVEDCSFRMLAPHEIQAAMGFPTDYRVLGTQRDKVKQLGNAVTPPVMELLFRRCVATLAG